MRSPAEIAADMILKRDIQDVQDVGMLLQVIKDSTNSAAVYGLVEYLLVVVHERTKKTI
ncbi:hypothetical protein [Paenibacillus phytohabitans]|uniref:hypothetical protein n=1 Tax=Paenibacillus phytohabitans TaxID=2654978 RepID=UPI001490EC4A|nr:hypothetical protein [Paenibacillus phytohabitans]